MNDVTKLELSRPAGRCVLVVDGEKTLRGVMATDVRVGPRGVLWLRGQVRGNMWIEHGGRVHVVGVLDGDVHVAGRLVIHGRHNGQVVSTPTASVAHREGHDT